MVKTSQVKHLITQRPLPPFIFIPFSLHFGQHVVQSPDLRRDGVDLDSNAVRVRPGDPGTRDARLPPGAKAAGVVERPDRPGEEARWRRRGRWGSVGGVCPGVGGVLLVDVGDGFGWVHGTQSRADGEAGGGEVGVWIRAQVFVVKQRRGVQGGGEEASGQVGRIVGVEERDETRPCRDRPDESGLDSYVFSEGLLVSIAPAVALQSLLQLLLQHLVPALQLVHFGQKAAEAQVQGLQHADVGAQVVAQSRGRRGDAVQGAAQVQVGEARRWQSAQVQPGQPIKPEPAVVPQEVARVWDGGICLARHLGMLLLRCQETALLQDRIHTRVGKSEVLEIRHEPRLL